MEHISRPHLASGCWLVIWQAERARLDRASLTGEILWKSCTHVAPRASLMRGTAAGILRSTDIILCHAHSALYLRAMQMQEGWKIAYNQKKIGLDLRNCLKKTDVRSQGGVQTCSLARVFAFHLGQNSAVDPLPVLLRGQE